MSEERSRKVGKSGRPKANKNSEVGGLKSEEKEASAIDIPHSDIKQLQTGNLKLSRRDSLEQTEQMEVHHHPEVEKKGIKEYVLEGLMIFLAVFMGFIAENIRESITNNERETQYMESLVKDLKLDAAILDRAAALKVQRMLAIDSVLTYFRKNINSKK